MSNRLCVLFLTYNRPKYAEMCIRGLLDNLGWSGELRVHIGDDGSFGDYAEWLKGIAGGYAIVDSTGVSNSEHRGYGANWNLATQSIHDWADYILQVEDDFLLTQRLDCDELVKVFEDSRVGCLRLGYMGFTQRLFGEVVRISSQPLLLLDPNSPEPHIWCGHPHLCTVDWQRNVGPWPEGITPQETEFYVSQFQARENIAWPMNISPDGGLFVHIGSVRAE